MDILLQMWGGGFYLLNKILLSTAQGRADSKRLRIAGWTFYVLGVPPWVILLAAKHDWIAAMIEVGGVPSMLLGLFMAIKGLEAIPKRLDRLSMGFAYAMLVLGVVYSVVDHNGIRNLSQILEMAVMAGFLGGTYLLAKGNRSGWLLFMVMNIGMGLLMLMRTNYILAAQQMVSLCFVLSGYVRSSVPTPEKQPA